MGNIIVTKSENFAKRIVNLYKYVSEQKKEYIISNQLIRSGTSIGANVNESITAQNKADFISKMSIALKEANESIYWIKLLHSTNYLNDKEFQSIYTDCEELVKMLTSIIKTTKKKSVTDKYKSIKSVIFDLDGTLIDSMNVWSNADKIFIEKYGGTYKPEISEKLKPMTIKQSSEFLISMLNIKKDVREISEEISDIVAYQYKNTIPLKSDVISITDFLKNNNIKFCVATATFRKLAEAVLKRHGIYERFEFVLTGEDVPEGKKSPAIYLKSAEMMGALPCETLVVEDSLHCIETCTKAGFPVVAVYDEYSKKEWEQMKSLADWYIYHLKEIKNIIKE